MQSDFRAWRKGLRYKLILTYASVTVGAIALAEAIGMGLVWLASGRLPGNEGTGWLPVGVVIALTAVMGLLLGAWASLRPARRLQLALNVSRAWLRGNLAVRIDDPIADELGLLSEQFDLLAERLEQDEQDLATLRERNERLTDQVRALAVVEERNRLARELHDSVKQHLFSLAMTASGIRARFDSLPELPAELAEMVGEVEKTAQTAQREMTRLIEDLRPAPLHEQGLAAALDDYALLLGAREHLIIYLEVQGNDALLPLSLSEPLYLVAQEALHNVARHARATRVDIHLRCIPEQVALTVRDNGVGFDPEQARRGLGLANMQERMVTAGGRLTVDSQIGAGTTVSAEVGLTHALGSQPMPGRQSRELPRPTIENWAWLGQRLVIPVGQTWPWLPADQAHLRRPLVDIREEPLQVARGSRFLGIGGEYVLQPGQLGRPLVRVHPIRSGYEWEADDASWALRRVRGLSGRMVLTRDGQPLAAVQYQGRMLNTWSEIVYDGRGYRLSHVKGEPGCCVLADEANDEAFRASVSAGSGLPHIELRRALPLPLLVLAALRIVDEVTSTTAPADLAESSAELDETE